ncbi:trehalose-phosphatase [Isoptericola sp. NEAU-Y5]|uniref:Trehalose 6-phosphate phosphatase n=1 Tax=Isoptericola luteus TaxID=2879484 RepID=A0ABS7ZDC2_9MICO|nr:trehalose-phosphatase [Isoptericola sp. NEAU-Y5]MCA5893041.1 trehalose-phosphatase [Isoptericola sp. NEAU-Y5]
MSEPPAPTPSVLAALTAFARPAGPGEGSAEDPALLVALDFDGTLAPLVDDPTTSRMTDPARAAVERLAELAGRTRVRLALVSGRDLADLADLGGPPEGTYLVGSHGAETGHVVGGRLESVALELDGGQRAALRDVAATLDEAATGHPGIWVQHKPSAAVLHTRLADDAAAVDAAVLAADGVADRLGLHALHGKDVVEIAVVTTSKGEAVERLRGVVADAVGAPSARVLYAGDDTTDERAFAVLHDEDLALKVGPGPTVAPYRVADADALAGLLERLADALERGSSPPDGS